MKQILVILLLLFSATLLAQDLNCSDFKTGKFIIPADKNVPIDLYLERTENLQIEEDSNGDKLYTDVIWLDECTYVLKINQSLTQRPLQETELFLVKNGGVKVVITKILDNGYEFDSSVTIEGEEMVFKGKMFFVNKTTRSSNN